MDPLMAYSKTAALNRLLGGQTPPGGRVGMSTVLAGIATFLGTTGIVLSGAALHQWVKAAYGLNAANLSIGLGCIALALLCVLAMLAIARSRRSKLKEIRKDVSSALHDILQTAAADLETPICENPKTAVFIAALAGFIAGERCL